MWLEKKVSKRYLIPKSAITAYATAVTGLYVEMGRSFFTSIRLIVFLL